MAKRKKKAKYNPDKAMFKSSIYAVKGVRKSADKKAGMRQRVAESNASMTAMEKGKKMALIEAYAKEHGVSITQAMIHFM